MTPSPDAVPKTILSIEGLSVGLPAGADRDRALSDVSLSLAANEILCVVGESGSWPMPSCGCCPTG